MSFIVVAFILAIGAMIIHTKYDAKKPSKTICAISSNQEAILKSVVTVDELKSQLGEPASSCISSEGIEEYRYDLEKIETLEKGVTTVRPTKCIYILSRKGIICYCALHNDITSNPFDTSDISSDIVIKVYQDKRSNNSASRAEINPKRKEVWSHTEIRCCYLVGESPNRSKVSHRTGSRPEVRSQKWGVRSRGKVRVRPRD